MTRLRPPKTPRKHKRPPRRQTVLAASKPAPINAPTITLDAGATAALASIRDALLDAVAADLASEILTSRGITAGSGAIHKRK